MPKRSTWRSMDKAMDKIWKWSTGIFLFQLVTVLIGDLTGHLEFAVVVAVSVPAIAGLFGEDNERAQQALIGLSAANAAVFVYTLDVWWVLPAVFFASCVPGKSAVCTRKTWPLYFIAGLPLGIGMVWGWLTAVVLSRYGHWYR